MTRLVRTKPKPQPGIVHFGPGAFFRAFVAPYTDEAMDAEGGNWGIIAVSLKSDTARNQLAAQDHVFTSVTLTEDGPKPKVVESITDVLVAPEDPISVIDTMADPAIKIVSLTITEKGYGYDPATKGLDLSHPDIAADLADPNFPKSAVGFIVAALEVRRQSGTPPFTVMSCDNLPANGATTRRVVLEYAARVIPELKDWIEENVLFPSTMVDRITPATTEADRANLTNLVGYDDPACVVHEAFRQWVIEDKFTMGRPAWGSTGAQLVENVEAHETMKLRCLNGTHSALAYLGYLAGLETVSDAARDGNFEKLCRMLWTHEILPTVPTPEGQDLNEYCASLIARYRDPSIRHRLWQIAMDGSQKLPQRILRTIQDRLSQGETPVGLCLVVAAWMRYVGGVDENGAPIDVRDPLVDRLRTASDNAEGPDEKVAAFLSMREVFGEQLASDQRFRSAVTAWLEHLSEHGARASVRAYLKNADAASV